MLTIVAVPWPVGVEAAFPGREPNDVVLWVPSRRAVVAGDTLVDFGDGLMIHEPWLSTPRAQVVARLLPLLDLPVEHVLATQTLPQSKPKTFRIAVEGKLPQKGFVRQEEAKFSDFINNRFGRYYAKGH